MDSANIWAILAGLVGLYLIVGPLLAILALRRIGALEREVAALRHRPRAAGPAPAAAAAPPPGTEAASGPTEAPEAEAEAEAEPEPGRWRSRLPAAGSPRAAPDAAPPDAGAPGGLEQSLTSRWLVWLGGVTLALGGAFLVKYSIDQGWLGPLVRVLLGLLFGAVLVAGGEALRRRPLQQAVAAIGPNYIPPALSAAGLAIGFVSLYAAYALYGLINPLTAFVALGALALGAIALSLLQGPFIAVLGLVGGYLTPLLIETGQPSPWALFGFLLALSAPAMVLVRARDWRWLGRAALTGAALWPALWLVDTWPWRGSLPLGGYLVLGAALFLLLRSRVADGTTEAAGAGEGWQQRLAGLLRLHWAAGVVFALLTLWLVQAAEADAVAIGAALALMALYLAVAWRDPPLDGLLAIAALLALALVAAWDAPADFEGIAALYRIEGRGYGVTPGPWVPAGFEPLVAMALLFAALLGLGGLAGATAAAGPASRSPVVWAATSALAPVALLAVAWWRIAHLGLDLKWSALALAVAAFNLAAAGFAMRRALAAQRDAVLGFAALGVSAAISLGAAMALEQAWLTVVLSLQLPVMAWLARRLEIASLRRVGAAVAALVLVRLLLNPYILDYPFGTVPGLSWVLYGYGIPAAAFWLAARWFGHGGLDARRGERLPALLDGGCLVFVFLLVSFEIRSLLGGTMRFVDDRLLEASLQSAAWLIMAAAVERLERRGPRPVLYWGWRALAALAALQVVAEQLWLENPLLTGRPVEGWPLLNVLALAYAAPGLLGLLFARLLQAAGHRRAAAGAGVLALALLLVWLTLELRRAFHGPVLAGPWPGEAELYAYSAGWLVYAGALLALGIARRLPALRYASLAVLLATVAKVFLLDLSDLAGLWRVASFVGLGLCLVGIGYLYQRFVFPPRAGAGAAAGEDTT